jgi:hypothetical protein
MKNENIRKTLGKSSKRPAEIVAELNEFLKKNGLQKTLSKDERIRKIIGPAGSK